MFLKKALERAQGLAKIIAILDKTKTVRLQVYGGVLGYEGGVLGFLFFVMPCTSCRRMPVRSMSQCAAPVNQPIA